MHGLLDEAQSSIHDAHGDLAAGVMVGEAGLCISLSFHIDKNGPKRWLCHVTSTPLQGHAIWQQLPGHGSMFPTTHACGGATAPATAFHQALELAWGRGGVVR